MSSTLKIDASLNVLGGETSYPSLPTAIKTGMCGKAWVGQRWGLSVEIMDPYPWEK